MQLQKRHIVRRLAKNHIHHQVFATKMLAMPCTTTQSFLAMERKGDTDAQIHGAIKIASCQNQCLGKIGPKALKAIKSFYFGPNVEDQDAYLYSLFHSIAQ